jgi:hypothetical protein
LDLRHKTSPSFYPHPPFCVEINKDGSQLSGDHSPGRIRGVADVSRTNPTPASGLIDDTP